MKSDFSPIHMSIQLLFYLAKNKGNYFLNSFLCMMGQSSKSIFSITGKNPFCYGILMHREINGTFSGSVQIILNIFNSHS